MAQIRSKKVQSLQIYQRGKQLQVVNDLQRLLTTI